MKTLGHFKDFTVKEVNGKEVRDDLSTDFAEWGTHLTYKFIPKKEIWIERQEEENNLDHLPFIVAAYTEHQALKAGDSQDRAYAKAIKMERKIRKKHKTVKKDVKIKEFVKYGDVSIWLVDGEKIRDFINSDFAEGGHGLVYKFIPKNEIWLDAGSLNDDNNIFVHELVEYNLMKKGRKYEHAHEIANKKEKLARKSEKRRLRILKTEIKKLLLSEK